MAFLIQTELPEWQNFITDHCYTCSDDILYCLGEMYAGGEQFTQGIDNADGKDTSEFVFRAIEIYCKNKN